jgi:RNA polymerase sigma-70 factor (ECF subfamily)
MSPTTARHQEIFETHRRALLGAAYRVLGTVADSEDAVQETWLSWQAVDLEQVRAPRADLLSAVTRTALNIVRSRDRRREEYIGPWLPEPVSTRPVEDPGLAAEVADDVSLALLVVLESLSPLERAAFVLREVFALPYAEVSRALDRSETSVRQLVSRARAHVRERAPRHPVDASRHRALTAMFLEVAEGRTALEEMLPVLAPDLLLTTDAKAALRPVRGVEKVLRFLAGVMAKPEVQHLSWVITEVNGGSALVGHEGDRVDCVVWLEADADVITRIDMVRNPGKLGAIRV